MSSSFPGMDRSLEAPDIWRGWPHSLADEMKTQRNAVPGLRYDAGIEVRTPVTDTRHLARGLA